MKKILFTVFVFLSSTLASSNPILTCDECKKEDKIWCIFTKDAKKEKLCLDKNAKGVCETTLTGTVALDCKALSAEDAKMVIPPGQKELPQTCGTCIADQKKWCVTDLKNSQAKLCVPPLYTAALCLNGEVHHDCKKVGDDDRHDYALDSGSDCEKCLHNRKSNTYWCVKVGMFGKYSNYCHTQLKQFGTSCGNGGGASNTKCDRLNAEEQKGSYATGTDALSTLVAVGVFLAAVI